MGLIISKREYKTDYFNGSDFSLNPSDTNPHLYGGVTSYTQVLHEIQVSWNSKSSISSVFTKDGDTLTRSSGSFILDGFAIGDIVDLESINYNVEPSVTEATGTDLEVIAIGDDYIIINGLDAAGFVDGDYGDKDNGLWKLFINGKNPLEGFVMNFGIIGNTETINFNSKLDETKQGYFASGVGFDTGGGIRDTNFVDGAFLGAYRSSKTGTLKVRYVDNPSTYVQRFEVEHTFLNLPYYLDGQDDNLENNTLPELFQDDSIKYAFKYEFRTDLADENTSKSIEDAVQKGSVGYWNVNYNGFTNDFQIQNLTYEDTVGDPALSLIVGELTTVKFRVNSSVSSFVNGSSIINIFSSYLPTQSEYEKKEETFTEIWEVEKYRDTLGNTTVTGQTIIQGVRSTFVDANNIDVEIDVLYVSKSQEDKYILGIEVANDSVVSGNANFVPLKIDFNTFQKTACIEDLGELNSLEIVDIQGNSIGAYGGYIEDQILLNYDFSIDHARETVIESIEVGFFAYNPTTFEQFDINMENVPFQTIAEKNDGTYTYQEITTNQDTLYRLGDTDPNRFRTINTGSLVGSKRSYNGSMGVKIPWQSWRQLAAASDEFVDSNEPFDGKNMDSSRYSNKEGFELRVGLRVTLTGLDDLGTLGQTPYYFSKPAFDVGTYDDDPAYTVTFETFDSNNNNLGGVLLANENTKIKVTVSPTFGSLDLNHIGVLRLEVSDSISERRIFEHNEAAIRVNYADNVFVGALVKNLVGSDLVFDSEIKVGSIADGRSYKLSLMVKCPELQCLVFQTNINPPLDGTFDPSVTHTGVDDFEWRFEDSSKLLGASISTSGNGLDGTIQNVSLCSEDLSKVTVFNVLNDKIVGTLNLNQLTSLQNLNVESNPNLTSIITTDAVNILDFLAASCDITGTLDISSLVNLNNRFQVRFSSNLTSIINPVNSNSLSRYWAEGCNLTGVLDMSGFTGSIDSLVLSNNINLTGITFSSLSLTGATIISNSGLTSLDLSTLSDFGSNFQVWNNSNLTSIINPVSSTVFTVYQAYNCNLTGTLDISGLSGLGGDFRVYNNSNLTSISNPTNSEVFSIYRADNCNLTGNIDVSGLTGLGGDFRVYNNANLTSITNPVSSQNFTIYQAYNCNLTGTLDLSTLTGLGGNFRTYGNSNLTTVTLPVTTQTFNNFEVYSCDISTLTNLTSMSNMTDINNGNYRFNNNNMTTGEVDTILADLDTISSGGFTGRSINIAGTNASPTGGAANVNVVSLIGKGFTVTITP